MNCYITGQGIMCSEGTVFLLALIVLSAATFSLFLLVLASWRLFRKAGRRGRLAFIPIYNLLVYLDIVQRPRFWIVLLCVPFLNIFIAYILALDLAHAYGKKPGFGVCIFFFAPLFLCVLAFGTSKYVGRLRPRQPQAFSPEV